MRTTCLILFVLSALLPSVAAARPKYMSAFNELYREHYVGNPKGTQCTVCHRGEKKTQRWKYGEVFSDVIAAKNVTDIAAIQRALRDVELKASAVPGMTYGDLIRAGRLPSEGE